MQRTHVRSSLQHQVGVCVSRCYHSFRVMVAVVRPLSVALSAFVIMQRVYDESSAVTVCVCACLQDQRTDRQPDVHIHTNKQTRGGRSVGR